MTNHMKDISPFMHTSLYRYSQFNTFDELEQSGIFKYCLTSELSEEIMKKSLCVKPTIDVIADTPIQEVDPMTDGWDISRSVAVPIVIGTEVPNIVEPERIIVPQNQHQNTRYSSRKPDTLFWSIFIAHYGVDEFTEIGSKYMNREMEEKMRVVEFIKKNRPRMKSVKITAATGEEMMGDLLTNQSTSMLVLPALALFYETRIWIVSEETNTYLEYVPTSYNRDFEIVPGTEINIDYSTMIIYRATYNGRVSYTTETNEEPSNLIEKIKQTMIRIENIEHPFKGISTYKLVDLEEIARKLNVQIPSGVKSDVVSTHFTLDNRKVEDQRESRVKWKKNEWYVAISRHAQLGWLEPTRTRKPRDH